MRSIVAFFVRYPVWTNVLMFSVFVFGFLYFYQMNYSFFPQVAPDVINIQVPFPGASPEEVEEGVILKIEENLDGLEGIERITSVSRENFGSVTIEVRKGFDIENVVQDVKNAVDQINSFPQDSEKPIVFEQKFRNRAVSIVLYGNTDLYNLKVIAENLRDRLLARPEISQVSFDGLPRLEFSIEVSEADMRRYNLTFNEIAAKVREFNVNISGGKFETRDEEILIRAYGRSYYAGQLDDLVLRGEGGGTVIYLKDVATIREQWEDVPEKSYYNGRPAVIVNVDHTIDEDILLVANTAIAVMDEFNQENRQITAEILNDQTISLRQRLSLLLENGTLGLMLVLITLGFFLNLRVSFWAAIGIPFSFAGMFIAAGMVGITINVISLFGMIIVVGILVDDAIVVAERIYYHFERGMPPMKAAVEGAMDVAAPVFTSIFTTVIAFTPYFFLDGFIGKFIWHMALVVIASLLWSLVEVFLVLPGHLAHSKALSPDFKQSPTRQKIERFIHVMTHRVYAAVLRGTLRNRWLTLSVPIGLLFITIGLMAGGLIGFTPFPFIDRDTLPISVSLVPGRQEADTDSVLARIERVVWQVNDDLRAERADGMDVVEGIKRDLGSNDFGDQGSHAGRLELQLLDGESRNMDSFIIANRIRDAVGPLPEVQKVSYSQTSFFGKDVSVSLLGQNLSELNRARDLLVAELNNMPSLKDVTDSNQEGRRELNIRLKPRALALGLTLQDVAGQVRQGFFGQEVQRIQRGRDEIRVWVRYAPGDRAALGNLDQMRIRTPDGGEYPFAALADYEIERGITAINRLNQLREVRVEASRANVRDDLPPILTQVQDEIVPGVLGQVRGVQASYEGSSRDRVKFVRSLRQAFPIAMVAMFILLVLVFRSPMQAVLIFGLIPFGVMCAILGHGIQGLQVNNLSIYGIIALTGIIINDSIVMVDQINRNLKEGMKVFDAVYNGAITRLRPILLTTLTTAVGLGPIIFETSRQAQFLIPMAVSVAYGILLGTFILLLVLPAAYLALNDVRMLFHRFFSSGTPTPESVEPAVKELETPAFN